MSQVIIVNREGFRRCCKIAIEAFVRSYPEQADEFVRRTHAERASQSRGGWWTNRETAKIGFLPYPLLVGLDFLYARGDRGWQSDPQLIDILFEELGGIGRTTTLQGTPAHRGGPSK